MSQVYIGTSGFSYPHWGNGIFYPKGLPQAKWFEYYCQYFKTVELNVSFYRLPKKEVFAGWREKAGEKFVFSVKGSRYITHIKRLKDCQEAVEKFFEAAEGLKGGAEVGQRNVILWQLPPGMAFDKLRLKEFLKILPKDWRQAFEFRHESWLNDEVFKLLKSFNGAVVFQDYPDWPITEEVTADFVYLRFHGKTDLYSSCYSEKDLKAWAGKINKWRRRGMDVYVYFNNDALGHAVENARTLEALAQSA